MSDLVSVRCRAVVLDMDGTLGDSTQVVELAWICWVVRHNIAFEDVMSFSHSLATARLDSGTSGISPLYCELETLPRPHSQCEDN